VERVGLLAGVSAEPTAMTAPAPELQVTTSERACMLASENAPVVLLPSQTGTLRFRSAVVNSDGVEHKAIVLVDSGSHVNLANVNLALFQYLEDVVTSPSDLGVKALGSSVSVNKFGLFTLILSAPSSGFGVETIGPPEPVHLSDSVELTELSCYGMGVIGPLALETDVLLSAKAGHGLGYLSAMPAAAGTKQARGAPGSSAAARALPR
jgi:hypothetical protein